MSCITIPIDPTFVRPNSIPSGIRGDLTSTPKKKKEKEDLPEAQYFSPQAAHGSLETIKFHMRYWSRRV